MSKAKDRKKAQEGKPFRQPGGKPEEKRQLCPFPNCGRTFIPEEKRPPFCNYHIQFISDYGFCVAHVRVGTKPKGDQEDGERPSGLVVPGPGASMGAAATDAIRRKGKGP